MDLSIKENICEYCGQALMPGEECNCPDAERERAKQQQAADAKSSIADIFDSADLQDAVYDIMEISVDLILNYQLNKLSLALPGGVKANISRNAGGKLKIERIDTTKDSDEIGRNL